jgi:HTH-type transcriptional regulator / antitoxin HigA
MMPEMTSTWTSAQYEAAISEFGKLWGASSGTIDSQRLDRLGALIDLYETQHYPVDASKSASASTLPGSCS